MVNTIARIKKMGKDFEVMVDLDNALKLKKGLSTSIEAESNRVFSDSKRGLSAPNSDLMTAFGTDDVSAITQVIVKKGEILVTQEHRDEEREKKIKQVVDLIVRSATDQNGRPYTPDKIKSSLEQGSLKTKLSAQRRPPAFRTTSHPIAPKRAACSSCNYRAEWTRCTFAAFLPLRLAVF